MSLFTCSHQNGAYSPNPHCKESLLLGPNGSLSNMWSDNLLYGQPDYNPKAGMVSKLHEPLQPMPTGEVKPVPSPYKKNKGPQDKREEHIVNALESVEDAIECLLDLHKLEITDSVLDKSEVNNASTALKDLILIRETLRELAPAHRQH